MTEQKTKDMLRGVASLKGPLPIIDFTMFPDTPHEAFEMWFRDAQNAKIREPHAMTLSTVDEEGCPDARVLILKNVDQRGWHFAIKANSPKGQQIEKNPRAALTFYWPALGRQIRLRGVAEALPDKECALDFLDRPIGSRVAAMASRQSEVLTNESDLDIKLSEAQEFLERKPDHVESGWRVFAVAPSSVEFWQGATDRNHKRLKYIVSPNGSGWVKDRLWP